MAHFYTVGALSRRITRHSTIKIFNLILLSFISYHWEANLLLAVAINFYQLPR